MAVVGEGRGWLRPLRRLFDGGASFTTAVVVIGFVLAYDQAGYSIASRSTTAMAVWWAVVVGIGLAVWPRVLPPREALVVGGLLAALAAWTFASIWWAPSAESAFLEFDRVTLYLGIFCAVVLAGTRANLGRWADGIAAAIVAIGVIALLSRVFPHLFSAQGLPVFLPGAQTRLSFPLGYWNGLAAFVGLGYPLVLRVALVARRVWLRALAVATLPIFSTVIYLASSRGGVVTAAIGVLVLLVATARRWRALAAVVVGMAGSAVAIAWLLPRHALVDGPIRSSTAVDQGRSAFALIVLTCLVTAAVYAIGDRLLRNVRPSRRLGQIVTAAIVVLAVVAIVASHPKQRFEAFKQLPGQTQSSRTGFVRSHLLSGSGSGRWQFWASAVDEFKSAPLIGRGAGSFEPWWAKHAPISYFVRNAHSLYLEILGELGIVGLVFLVGAFVFGATVGFRRLLTAERDERVTVAALLAVLAGFYLSVGIEWVWQLTAVTAIGIVALALLTGPATARMAPRPAASGKRTMTRLAVPRYGAGLAILVAGWLIICAQAIPWLTDLQLRASTASARQGDARGALKSALAAKRLEPWAVSPYLQLALVDELAGQLRSARKRIDQAIRRDSQDWRLWLVSARIETKLGDVRAAERSLLRAASLNPRSPLFAGIGS